ncbi:hypothetical protein QYG89_09910 [Bacillus sp. B190/17]|uniref:YfhD family protein n=1 Tax=Bacillus lumedeiriae TaxID=3058829 RepID=A0ABW8I919_9BACI
MGRGKSFSHKEKGNPGNYPQSKISGPKEQSQQLEQINDIATYEAFKNRVPEDDQS